MKVAWLPLDDSPAQRAAWAWISTVDQAQVIRCTPGDGTIESVLDLEPDVVWIDAAGPVTDATAFTAMLRAHTGFLLTGGAVMLPSLLGVETGRPGIIDRPWKDDEDELCLFRDFTETPRIRGHAAFRRHRLFDGLGSAAYTWWPHDGDAYRAITWRLPDWPASAAVIAVERAFIHIEHDRATIWEYASPRILCIGAFLPFESNDPLFRPHRERLALNALRHAAGLLPARLPDLHWRPPRPRRIFDPSLPLPRFGTPTASPARGDTRDLTDHSAPPSASAGGAPGGRPAHPGGAPFDPGGAGFIPVVQASSASAPHAEPLPFHLATLRLPGGDGGDPVTLAGRRTLAAGDETRGITEVWCHPVRVMANLRLPCDDARPGAGSGDRAEITSLGLIRSFRRDNATVIERTFVPRDLPGLVIEWENTSDADVVLDAEWETDLRLMWPYAAGVLGPIHWNADATTLRVATPESGESVSFVVRNTRGDGDGEPAGAPDSFGLAEADAAVALAGYPQPRPDSGVIPDTSAFRLPCTLHVRVPARRRVSLLVAAATSPGDDAGATLAALTNAPSLVRARTASLRRLQREHLSIVSPDERLDRAVEWAKVRLDGYLVDTPGVGRSLVAGYWTSRPGWNDGRPGYAWYFGRDAVWTAFACLAAGLFDASRDVIAFLARHQDLNGKILHECTTSGSVHYDAADSTPLWLLLVARHLAWTGDLAFTRSVWPCVERAIAFCTATDTDGDGLIENTRVGHGWIEFGRLGGGRATFYNAGIWTAALRELAIAAEAIGDTAAATRLNERHRRARASLEQRFFDPDRGTWALRIEPHDFTPTATHAVPLLLGAVDPATMERWLDLVGSDEFTADWGVRLIPRSDPDFDPASYHGGAVWPLYTGWAGWAEFEAGRCDSAFRHWYQVARLAFQRDKGAWDEVLHGSELRAIGVCPDQAWSTAMAVSPLVAGLLGAAPDAPRNRLILRPAIPDAWSRLDVRNLRMGDALIDIGFRRDGPRCTFRLAQEAGAVPVRLVFEPAVSGRAVLARVDGQPAALAARAFGERLVVPVQLVLDHERVVELDILE